MAAKEESKRVKAEATYKETLLFAEEAFDSVWNRHEFEKKQIFENFLESYSERVYAEDRFTTKYFTEGIGNAVYVSQFLLRNRFKHFFHFNYDSELFKKEVKFLWSHWIEERDDIFVKVIDTIAVIADAFLFCDTFKSFNLELKEASSWFMEWFEENLSSEFFKAGGWKELKKVADEKYTMLCKCIKKRMKVHSLLKYCKFTYDDDVIKILRDSKVFFPVHKSEMTSSRTRIGDENLMRKIVYIRLKEEIPNPEKIDSLLKSKDCEERIITSSETEIKSVGAINVTQSEPLEENDKTEKRTEVKSPHGYSKIGIKSPKDKNVLNISTGKDSELEQGEVLNTTEDSSDQDSSFDSDKHTFDPREVRDALDKALAPFISSVPRCVEESSLEETKTTSNYIDFEKIIGKKESPRKPRADSKKYEISTKRCKGNERNVLPTAHLKDYISPEKHDVVKKLLLEEPIVSPVVQDFPGQASNEPEPFDDFMNVVVEGENPPSKSKFYLFSEKYSYSIGTMRKQRFKKDRKRKFSITKLEAESKISKRDFVLGEIGQEAIPDSGCPLEEMHLSEYICMYLGELSQQQRIISGIEEPAKSENPPDSPPQKN